MKYILEVINKIIDCLFNHKNFVKHQNVRVGADKKNLQFNYFLKNVELIYFLVS